MSTKGSTVEPMTFESPSPALFELPLASSRYGLPDSYAKAHAAFELAQKDYQGGRFAQAAGKFIAVADLVKAPKEPTTYSAAYAKMRAAAYRDAALSYGLGARGPEGKKVLLAAAKHDAENAKLLASLADGLG